MPEATVAAIITTKDSRGTKILLTRRGIEPFKGQWCLPGGHIDPNEPADAAIIREVKEETGLDFEGRFFSYFDELPPPCQTHAVVMVFEGSAFGKLLPQEGEVSDIKWFSICEAQSRELAYTHNAILDAYVRRKLSPGLRREILAEYSSLRAEIIGWIELRYRLLFWTLVIAGSFLAAGVEEIVKPSLLLVYPVLAMFLAAAWAQCDIRTGQIGEYIRTNIEERLAGMGWEGHLRRTYAKREKWMLRHLVEISSSGIFVTSEILVSALALYKAQLDLSVGEVILLAVDGVVVVLTGVLVSRRRKMYREKPRFWEVGYHHFLSFLGILFKRRP